jgi:hypothetical protein
MERAPRGNPAHHRHPGDITDRKQTERSLAYLVNLRRLLEPRALSAAQPEAVDAR